MLVPTPPVVRVAYTHLSPDGRNHIYVSECDTTLTTCFDRPDFTTGPRGAQPGEAGHQINPKLAVWPGSPTQQPVWKLVYDTMINGGPDPVLTTRQANLVYNPTFGIYVFQPFDLLSPREICPTLTTTYWGDYDYVIFNQLTQTGVPEFMVGGTDSHLGCAQYDYYSVHQHVSVAFAR